jgi:mersacidin/lichenicidin family type 2 lantibiotic
MNPSNIIRAWKDPGYRAGLSATQLAQLPAHPAGAIELPEPTRHSPPTASASSRASERGLPPLRQITHCYASTSAHLWQDALMRP